jgi:hypothetical protein
LRSWSGPVETDFQGRLRFSYANRPGRVAESPCCQSEELIMMKEEPEKEDSEEEQQEEKKLFSHTP